MKTLPTLVVALLLAGCADDPQAAAARAREAVARHDYPAAQVELAAALAANPADPGLTELHARTALAMGDGVAAKASLDRLPATRRPADHALLMAEAALLREQPDEALALLGSDGSARALRLRALAFLAKGDRARAAEILAHGVKAHPSDAALLAAHARVTLMGGNAVQARVMADRALAADPGLLEPMLVDAQVATAQGDLGRALATYDKAVKQYPGNLAALSGKAAVLGDLGRTDEMEALLARIGGTGSDGSVAYLRARAAAAKGNWASARDILQENEALLAGRDEAALLHGQVLSALGQPEQARVRLMPLLRKAPASALVRRELARAQMAAADGRGAVETLRPLALRPDADAEDVRMLARAAALARDPAARGLATRATFPAPQSLAAALATADAAMKARNWASAIAAYDRVMAVTDGRNPIVLNNLAVAHGAVGNRGRAVDFARRAYREASGNASIMDTLGWLLWETGGDRSEALRLLRAAAAKAPDNATIRDHLARAERG